MTGLKVSALGFGCGSIGGLMVRGDPAQQRRAVQLALEAGITYFDTAPSYGDGRSEENLGRVLRELGAWDRVVVGTKVRLEEGDLQDPRGAVRRSLEASLRRLGRDAVDLFQLHNRIFVLRPEAGAEPVAGAALGLEDAIGEVAEALKDTVKAGLARFIGFTGLGDAIALRETALAEDYQTVQCYFNAINASAGYSGADSGEQDFEGLIDTAARANLGVIAIRVLAGGAMVGQLERHQVAGEIGEPIAKGAAYERDVQRARQLGTLASELGLENALELSLRFVLSKPGVSTALVGYSDLAQLESAIRWAERGPLPDAAVQRVIQLARE